MRRGQRRFVKPLDRTLLLSQAACLPCWSRWRTMCSPAGFGSAVLEALQEADCQVAVERIGWPTPSRTWQQCRRPARHLWPVLRRLVPPGEGPVPGKPSATPIALGRLARESPSVAEPQPKVATVL